MPPESCRCFRQQSLGTAARRRIMFPAPAEAADGELPPAPAMLCLGAKASHAQLESFWSFTPRDEDAFKIHTTSCQYLLAPSSTRNDTQADSLLLSVKIQLPPSSLHSPSPSVQAPSIGRLPSQPRYSDLTPSPAVSCVPSSQPSERRSPEQASRSHVTLQADDSAHLQGSPAPRLQFQDTHLLKALPAPLAVQGSLRYFTQLFSPKQYQLLLGRLKTKILSNGHFYRLLFLLS